MNKVAILIGMFMLCGLLVSCAEKDRKPASVALNHVPIASIAPIAPDEKVSSPPTSALEAYKNTIWKNKVEIEKKHAILIQMFGSGNDHIFMQIRSKSDVERVITDKELTEVKKTITEFAGAEFPIDISVWACCSGPATVTGKITKFEDDPTKRILVVNEEKKNGNTNDPEATYIELENDGILIVDGERVLTGFTTSLVGREVKVWTTGMMLQSYPEQGSGLKVVVE